MLHHIREIDYRNKQDVDNITRLHLQLLPFGPMAQLGELFLRRFCYTVLLREGLMKASIYEVDRCPAGFIVYTHKSITFHRTAIKKHWLYVSFLVMVSLIQHPSVILRLWRALRLIYSRQEDKVLGEDPQAEILAIGVLPEYSKPGFIRRTGLRISEELFNHAVSYFQEIGLKKMRLTTDADNKPTILFYHGLGGRLEPRTQAGKSVVDFWFELEQKHCNT